MRPLIATFVAVLSLLTLVPAAFAGERIDGVVATVNRQPVLRSEWDEAVRFEAFLHQEPLARVTDSERAAALQRLIDRTLLTAQMEAQHGFRPSPAEVTADISKLRDKFSATEDAKWHALLASYGLSETTIAAHLGDEVQVMNYIDVQLRPNVRIQDSDVHAYYQAHVVPGLQQSGAKIVPLDEIAANIRELLVQQHMDEVLDAWLHNLRQQSHIQTLVPLPTMNAQVSSSTSEGGQ